jgi:hypothetical protein
MDQRAIYYNNFATHLLNAYNPNMYYPGLPHQWSDQEWCALVDMIASFGFTVFEFWLEPHLFCREGLESQVGREYARQMNVVIRHALEQGLKTEMIAGLATSGPLWRTLCPNLADEWGEIRFLWDRWCRRFPDLGIVGIFPGDPGACSRNGCVAETFIDRSIDVAQIARRALPQAEVEFNTWGPPFFGWGNLYMPPDSKGEFVPEHQVTAWTFDKGRAERSMNHLLRRLDDFPTDTSVSINLGFNSDGDPRGDEDARPWAREIARKRPILTWDFSLTEGENAIYPHYRFDRLFARRQEELAAAPYSGGICFTMTPRLNQLSLYEAAQSFHHPDADHTELARTFYLHLFGLAGAAVAEYIPYFEVIPDWGYYGTMKVSRGELHGKMVELATLLRDLRGVVQENAVFHPAPELYRQELAFFAQLFAELTSAAPDYDALRERYWQRVYRIYDQLPAHVDPRPVMATNRLIDHFREMR